MLVISRSYTMLLTITVNPKPIKYWLFLSLDESNKTIKKYEDNAKHI